jgi:alkylation response protein AidB-like acyl-CoA dehydrogenase
MDQTRALAEVTLADVRVPTSARLARSGPDVVAHVRSLARIALAAEQVGGAQRALDLSVEYAKVRQQFGKPIGSFQAVQHKCADMFVLVESARSAAYYAGWAADHAPDELVDVAPTTAAYCSDAFFRCAGDTIQVHGGIGFTWEHDAHLLFKRARASRSLLGAPDVRRDEIAHHLGLGVG